VNANLVPRPHFTLIRLVPIAKDTDALIGFAVCDTTMKQAYIPKDVVARFEMTEDRIGDGFTAIAFLNDDGRATPLCVGGNVVWDSDVREDLGPNRTEVQRQLDIIDKALDAIDTLLGD
jgi:hypothetical protein